MLSLNSSMFLNQKESINVTTEQDCRTFGERLAIERSSFKADTEQQDNPR